MPAPLPPLQDDRLMSAAQLHAEFGIPLATWLTWANRGTGPKSFHIGRRRVWRRSVVLDWFSEQESAGYAEQERRAAITAKGQKSARATSSCSTTD